MSSKDESEKPTKDLAEVDLMRQAATDSIAASSKEPKNKRQRRRKPFDEAISTTARRVFDVRSTDIIFGRGKGYQDHPGNKRMRAIIRRYKEEYNSIHRSRKRDLVESVYSEITQDGARFLHKSSDEDVFVVVDVPIALQKVRNTLRCKKSGMIPTEEDDEVLTSTAAVVEGSMGTVAEPKLKNPQGEGVASSSAAVVQESLPLDMAGLGNHPLASHAAGLMPSSAMLSGSQLEQQMFATMNPAGNPLLNSALLANDFLRQTHYAGLAAGLNAGLGGMQLPLPQQQHQQQQQAPLGGIPGLAGSAMQQHALLLLLQGGGSFGFGPFPSPGDAPSCDPNSNLRNTWKSLPHRSRCYEILSWILQV